MSGGIIEDAVAGGFGALADVGKQMMSHTNATEAQERAAQLQAIRDETLAELRRGELEHADELKRAPGKRAGEAIKAGEQEFVDDPSGTARQRTPGEMAEMRAGAYSDEGLIGEAQKERDSERAREKDSAAVMDKTTDNARLDRHEDIIENYYKGTLKNSAARPRAGPKTITTEDGYLATVLPDSTVQYLTDDQGEYVRAQPRAGASAGEVTPRAQLSSIEKEIAERQRELKDEYMPAEKSRINREIAELTARREALRGGGGDPGRAAAPQSGWNQKTGQVVVNGQAIGTADTREAAKKLRDKFLAQQK